jgi:hypothetical protein
MPWHYRVQIGKERFDIAYMPGVHEISINLWPYRCAYKSCEELGAKDNGILYELGPGKPNQARRIRAALPELSKHKELPTDVRKAIRGIQL